MVNFIIAIIVVVAFLYIVRTIFKQVKNFDCRKGCCGCKDGCKPGSNVSCSGNDVENSRGDKNKMGKN